MTGPTVIPSPGQHRAAPADKSQTSKVANNRIDALQLQQQLTSLQAHLSRLESRQIYASPSSDSKNADRQATDIPRDLYHLDPVWAKNRVPVSQDTGSGFRLSNLFFPLVIVAVNIFILEAVLSSQTPKTSLFSKEFWQSTLLRPAMKSSLELIHSKNAPNLNAPQTQLSDTSLASDIQSSTSASSSLPAHRKRVTGNSQTQQKPSILSQISNTNRQNATKGMTNQEQASDRLSIDRLEQAVLGELSTTRNEIDRLAISQQESDAILQDIQARLNLFSRYIAYRSKGYSVGKAWSRANISPNNTTQAPLSQKTTDPSNSPQRNTPQLTDPLVSPSLPPLPVGKAAKAKTTKVTPAPLGYFYRTEANQTPLQISAMHGVPANELSRQNGWNLKNLNVALPKGTRIFIPEDE